MTASRRPRSDSVETAIKAFRDAARRIEWPELEVTRLVAPEDDSRAQAIFDRIMSSRSADDWRDFDPILAANLATTTVELDKLLATVAVEGWTVPAGRDGTQRSRSPYMDPIQHLTTRQLSLARALGLTGEPADAKTVAKNARTAKDAKSAADIATDSLLAGFGD